MVFIIIFLLLLSDLGLAYAYFISLNLPGITKTLSWIAPKGSTLNDFIPAAILIALISQIIMIGLLLFLKARRKALLVKLREERELNERLRVSAKEFQKKASDQEKALKSAETAAEKAELLQEKLKSEQEMEKACRENIESLKYENKQLQKELGKLERSEKLKRFVASFRAGWADRIDNARQKLRNIIRKG